MRGIVLIGRLVERDDQLDRAIDERDQMRKRVAEEAADAQRDVDARTSERSSGIDREILNAARLRIPDRLDAEQRQHLGDVVAVRAHLRRAPGAEADHLRVAPLFGEVAVEHLARQLLADAPRGLRRQRARIDGVEVAAGRQHVRHAARRRAGRTGGT